MTVCHKNAIVWNKLVTLLRPNCCTRNTWITDYGLIADVTNAYLYNFVGQFYHSAIFTHFVIDSYLIRRLRSCHSDFKTGLASDDTISTSDYL